MARPAFIKQTAKPNSSKQANKLTGKLANSQTGKLAELGKQQEQQLTAIHTYAPRSWRRLPKDWEREWYDMAWYGVWEWVWAWSIA